MACPNVDLKRSLTGGSHPLGLDGPKGPQPPLVGSCLREHSALVNVAAEVALDEVTTLVLGVGIALWCNCHSKESCTWIGSRRWASVHCESWWFARPRSLAKRLTYTFISLVS